jgi:elongator complex protein 5
MLQSLITPSTSLLLTYHLDLPNPVLPTPPLNYSPDPLKLLAFMATTVIKTHALAMLYVQKQARERSLPEPIIGLEEGVEGVLKGGNPGSDRVTSGAALKKYDGGCVLEVEFRRKSGRAINEWFWLAPPSHVAYSIAKSSGVTAIASKTRDKERLILLDDHPLFKTGPSATSTDVTLDSDMTDTTFNLGLTEKQRRDREGVVLPYMDAQKEQGWSGEGGRILYDMGVEDDFDEEEDEI